MNQPFGHPGDEGYRAPNPDPWSRSAQQIPMQYDQPYYSAPEHTATPPAQMHTPPVQPAWQPELYGSASTWPDGSSGMNGQSQSISAEDSPHSSRAGHPTPQPAGGFPHYPGNQYYPGNYYDNMGYAYGPTMTHAGSQSANRSAGMSTVVYLGLLLSTFMSCGLLAPFALVGCIIDLSMLKKAGRRDTGLTWASIVIYAVITLVGLGLLAALVAFPLFL